MKSTIYFVLPCYNEEEVIIKTALVMIQKVEELIHNGLLSAKSRIVFVDDGSKDNTWKLIKKESNNSKRIIGIKLSSNRGHQIAVLAGYKYSANKCDAVISLDADLQHDINAINKFIDKYEKGNQIVYGVRNSRNTDGFFKKKFSLMFYKIMKLLGCTIIPNHADYRLVSNDVLVHILNFNEQSIFLRGILPYLGFQSDYVYFDVKEREAGKSKYNVTKMLKLASDGITSFSSAPLHMIWVEFAATLIITILLFLIYFINKSIYLFIICFVLFGIDIVLLNLGIINVV